MTVTISLQALLHRGDIMKKLILEYNKTACLRQLMVTTDAHNKIMIGTVCYRNVSWLIIARKRSKRMDLTYYDCRKQAYFFHHSYSGFGRKQFLEECKTLISDIVDNCLEDRKCKPWYER